MSTEEFDISDSLAAELTSSVGLQEDGGGDVPESLADDLADHEQYQAEKDLRVSDDVEDTRQGELDREVEQEQTQQRGKKVPLAALQEERQKRQALEAQLAAQQQQLQQFQAQWQAAQQAQQEAAIPDFDEDPRGHIEAVKQQFAQQLAQLKGQGQPPQVEVAQLEARVIQEAAVLAPAIAEAEARFEAANPDYQQAFGHVMATVEQNMRAQHPGINDQQLGMLRTAAFVELTKQCQANGVSPAEHIYNRAKAMGYQPPQRAPRREAPTSLSTLAGSARAPDERGAMSASQISDMNEREFDQFWNEMKRDSVARPKF